MEQRLGSFVIFCECILFGVTLNYLVSLEFEKYSENPFTNLWITFDCFLMSLTHIYGYMSYLIIE
jgi:hypothetical protein